MTKTPPIPKENQRPEGQPATNVKTKEEPIKKNKEENPDKQGQTANTRQNTRNQGYQQQR
jgi:hypothetical protein